jgi:hypothetical protein
MKYACLLLALAATPVLLVAQQQPALPGQDAYGAISEIVRLLEADPQTDWSRVDVEKLRQHLIDMNVVTLQSRVMQHAVPGGIDMTVTGDGRTEAAIRRMVTSHAIQLGALGLTAKSEPVAGGVHFVVTARDPADTKLASKIQGLGFIGIMSLGAHHAVHHLALARGVAMAGH